MIWRSRRSLWALSALSLFAWSCQLTKSDKVENTLSFSRLADSLKSFDKTVIVLKQLDGTPLDTIYQAKVIQDADVKDLLAPHWDGSRILVEITGIKDGKVVYQVETRYDRATGIRDGVQVYVTPDLALSSTVHTLSLLIGDSSDLPTVTIQPANLLDKTLEWMVDSTTLVKLGPTYLLALRAGKGELTVRLKTHPDSKLSFPFTITEAGTVPQSITIDPESLKIAANGPSALLTAKISPSAASSAVTWTSADTGIASVDTNGRVQGKRAGETSILATSAVRLNVHAFAHVKVTDAVPVTRVIFANHNLSIVAGSAAESLLVTVQPTDADPSVSFTVSDPNKASLQNGKISGIAAGTLTVIATSVSNPLAKDTLHLTVTPPSQQDTVPPLRPNVHVNPVGPTKARRPVWTWSSGGGGSGIYQVLLDKTFFDTTTSISLPDTTYTPSADLSIGVHVLYVRERDAAGNWSPPGSAQVEIDTAGPAAPLIHGTSPTAVLPRWTWGSGGNGGAGVFRSRLADANFPAGASESTDTIFTIASAIGGTTYTLYVEERDAAGNWSPSANLPIKYDLSKPVVAISVPQASGTFITAFDTVTIAGSASGPNGIAKIDYTVNAGAATSLTVGTGGAWRIASLRVANAATLAIKVTATDSLGNKGEANLSILRDSILPLPPVALSKPASPTNVPTASWTWAPGSDIDGSGLNGKYRWKLDAGAWTETSSAAATGVALTEGTSTFYVQEQDKAGNWSASVTGDIMLDTKVPDAVTFVGTDSSVVTTLTPTWKWIPSVANGGIDAYILKLDNGIEFDWPTRTYTPTTPLRNNAIHTLIVKEKDYVPGVIGPGKPFRIQVGLDPNKPWGGLKNIAAKTSGCGNSVFAGSGKFTTTSGGQSRTYIVDVPDGYDWRHPYRLFYCSHWLGTSADTMAAQNYLSLKTFADADTEHAFFIAPQALGTTWTQSDHVLFDDILAQVKSTYCIDSTRIFAVGFSIGASFTYSLSTTHQNQIRAAVGIAPANYNIYLPSPLPRDPIAWMQTTGVNDVTDPWISGTSTTQGAKYIAIQRAQDNGCTVPATIPTWQTGDHVCYDFSGCKPEYPTKACTFNGVHTNVNIDAGSTENWIPAEAWKFFTQF
ncbi:MAG: Ig-like domain-containing protein [Fibrobacteres bacterium]|jgi:hypothetical protein|nr:Ig-like domain-containing protein [Fibrobacterota bacterium]